MEALIEVNNRSMVKMTRIVLPGMKERKKGAIVNIGSFAGSTTDPFYSIYSGSKVRMGESRRKVVGERVEESVEEKPRGIEGKSTLTGRPSRACIRTPFLR